MMDKNKQKLFNKIYQGSDELTSAERTAVGKDSALKNELKVAASISSAIATRPLWTAPATLRQRLFEKLVRPTYKAWQLILAMLVVAICPLFVPNLTETFDPALRQTYSIALFILYGLIVAFISFPLTFLLRQLLMTHFERFVDRIDGKEEVRHTAA